MNKKKILISVTCCLLACTLCFYCVNNKNKVQNEKTEKVENNFKIKNNTKPNNKEATKIIDNKTLSKNDIQNNTEHTKKEKHIDLYDDNSSNSTIPLSGIVELADISKNASTQVKNTINDSNAVYFLTKQGNKIFMIVDNPEDIRHGIDFVEISANNGHCIKSKFGHSDKINDTENEIWEYDKSSDIQRPTKHSVYDSQGDLEFSEEWNYNDNPIKYEKKDREGNVVAIKKETIENDSNLRIENILYDSNGNTIKNITASYEGEDLKRFTYYNAGNIDGSASVISEYENGQMTKETLYTSDFKLKNIYESNYQNDMRTDISVYDSNNELQIKYLPLSK